MSLALADEEHSTTGAAASGTSATVTLPTYDADSKMFLVLGAGQNITALTFGSDISAATLRASAVGEPGRLGIFEITPNGTPTTFGLTWTTAAFYRWQVLCFSEFYTGTTRGNGSAIGGNTTAAMAFPAIGSFPANTVGDELCIRAGLVNATATWSAPGDVVYTSTTGNAGMQVCVGTVGSGLSTLTPAALDRGLGGTSRNESVAALMLFPGLPPEDETNCFDASGNPLYIFDASGNPLVAVL